MPLRSACTISALSDVAACAVLIDTDTTAAVTVTAFTTVYTHTAQQEMTGVSQQSHRRLRSGETVPLRSQVYTVAYDNDVMMAAVSYALTS
jgi:hypothetical protein